MTIKILGFAGSLRKASYNRAALRAAQSVTPEGTTFEIYDLAAIPLYNDDIREKGYPPEVQDFRDKIAAADAIVMATPEYNYSISGILKNAIDWASRPPSGAALSGKPVGDVVRFLANATSDESLRRIDCVLRIDDSHPRRRAPDERRVVRRKVDDRGSQARASFIRDQNRKASLHHSDE